MSSRNKFGFKRSFAAKLVEQAFIWSSIALASTRRLDSHGLVPWEATERLSSLFSGVVTTRIFVVPGGGQVNWLSNIPCAHVILLFTLGEHRSGLHSVLKDRYSLPLVPKATTKVTLDITLKPNTRQCWMNAFGLVFGRRLQDVIILLRVVGHPVVDNSDLQLPNPFGTLQDLMQDALLHLDRVTYSIVGLDQKAVKAIGAFSDEELQTTGSEIHETPESTAIPSTIKETFTACLEDYIRNCSARGWLRHPWTDEQIRGAAARVHLLSWEE